MILEIVPAAAHSWRVKSDDPRKDIERRLGRVPAFFAPALDKPAVLASLWTQAKALFLDNPAPALFKEKLLARLSRYCGSEYCLVSHSVALRRLGMTAAAIWDLLKRPAPVFDQDALRGDPGAADAWPEAGSAAEERWLSLAEAAFLHPGGPAEVRGALRRLAGPARFEEIWSLLAFARLSHSWLDFHREVTVDKDPPLAAKAADLSDQEPMLADFFHNYHDMVQRDRQSLEDRLINEVARRQQMQEELTRYAAEMEESRDRMQDQASQMTKLAEELYKRREDLLLEIKEREKVEASNRVFAEMVRNMPIGLNVWELEDARDPKSFRLVATNPAVRRFTGVDLSGALGKRMLEVFPYLTEVPDLYAEVIATNKPKDMGESTYGREDGPDGFFSVRVFPLPNRCVGVSYEDVTERKQAEEELSRARDAALELARTRSEFLANMSHEIRTPLNAIVGMTNLLADAELSRDQREMAMTASRAGDALLGIVNDILDFSKIEAGKLALESVDFDLRTLVESALELVRPRAQAKGLGLSAMYDDGVPFALRGDPTRLRQVLINLVANAVKFTERGEVVLRASLLSRTETKAELRLAVSDTGIGIAPEALRRLFQAFSQADSSTTRKYGGTGLGLAICKRIMELMGGEIGVESEVGSGSTFWCRLAFDTARPGAARPPAGPPREAPATRSVERRRYFRILLVEDNPVNQKVAQLQLGKLGYRADTALDGLEALRAFERGTYDLILMDCQMPGMDGFEATAEIRKRENGERRTPIVAMTANALEGDREKCLAAGMSDYLSKPVDMKKLTEILSRWDVTLDASVIQGLRELAGDEVRLVRDVIDQFLKDAPMRLEAIRTAVRTRDPKALEKAAHSLKGAGGNIGAKALWAVCEELERLGRSDVTQAAEPMEVLEEEFKKLVEELEKEKGK
jgi:PAS domain S-box-containing protein